MGTFLWSQLLNRRSRSATLGVGVLVAGVSFALLTSAASTSKLRVSGAVSGNFRAAYDILVRPQDSFTPLEKQQGLIQQNYLSGIFGGISFQEYREIRNIPGVEVAAPIANIGYVMPYQTVPVTINRLLSKQPVQMYRLRFEWSANNGLSHYLDNPQYIYYTRRNRFEQIGTGPPSEVLPGGRTISPCLSFNRSAPVGPLTPFQLVAYTGLTCLSATTPSLQGGVVPGALPPGHVGQVQDVFIPILMAAIDPVEEDRLLGFSDALASGRMLGPSDRPRVSVGANRASYLSVPFVASTRTYLDETLQITIERLRIPSLATLYDRLSSDTDTWRFVTELPTERVLATETRPIGQVYQRFLHALSLPIGRITEATYGEYWTTSPANYSKVAVDRLAALPTGTSINPSSAATTGWAGPPWRTATFISGS
jgi:hypothetical protein